MTSPGNVISVIITGNTTGLTGALARASAATQAFAGQQDAAAGATSRLGAAAKAGATLGVIGLGVAFVAAVGSAIQFEATMHNVASIDAEVRASFQQTSQDVLNLSKHVPQSANTLAEGLYNIASSGLYGAKAMHVLDVSAHAASAGLTDTGTASKAIVAALNAYGMEASEAGRVSDALFSTVNYGVITFEQLTGAIAHSVGNAAKAGVSIEQLGAALATMTLSGMSASEAGVSLNNLLSKLVKPSKALGQAAFELGINLREDLANPAIGLHGVMEKLMVASQGNLSVLLQWFPEIRAARGALALMSADGETYNRVFGQMGDQHKTAGATLAVFNEQAKSAKFQLEELGNKIAVAGIQFGMTLLPGIKTAVEGLDDLGGAAKRAVSGGLDLLAPGLGGLRAAAGDVVDIIGDVAGGLAKIATVPAGVAIAVLGAAFNGLGVAVGATTGFLADHEQIVYAVAAAYVAWNLTAITAGVRSLAATIQVGAYLAWSAAVSQVGAAFTALQARLTLFGTSWAAMGAAAGIYGLAIAGVGVALESLANSGDRAKAKVDALVGSMDPESIESLGQAIERLTARYAELGGTAGAIVKGGAAGKELTEEAKQLLAKIEELKVKYGELSEKLATVKANTSALAEVFGISGEAVTALAAKYKIDLSGGIGEVTEKMRAAVEATRDSAPATLSSAQALNILTFDAKAADAALESLATTWDLVTGRAISAEESMAKWRITLLDLAAGALNAKDANGALTTSLDENTRAGNENIVTLLGIVTQGKEMADAEFKRQVALEGVDAATAAYNNTLGTSIEQFTAAAVAAGFNKGEIDKLLGVINLLPPEVSTDVTTPGLPGAIDKSKEYQGALGVIERAIDTTFGTPGLLGATADSRTYQGALGVIERAIDTNFGTPGLPEATSGSRNYQGALGVIERAIHTAFSTPGLDTAIGQVAYYTGYLNQVPRSIRTTITTEQITINRQQNQYPQGFASGGEITGPGGPTGDRILIAASSGEWVIPASVAAGQGARRMAALVAGRAVVIPAFAAGGPLGGRTGAAPAAGAGAGVRVAVGAGYVELTAAQLAEIVPLLRDTDRQAGRLAETSAGANRVMLRWRDTLAATGRAATGTTEADRLLTAGLVALGAQMGAMGATQYPLVLLGTQAQTLAQAENTLANTENLTGLTVLGAQMDVASGAQLPTLATSTTTASAATTAFSATQDQATADLAETTAAVTETTAAVDTYITTAAAVVPLVQTEFTTPGLDAAQAGVAAYVGTLASVPANITTTITTAYVTTGSPAAPAGFAGGGQVLGPGGPTSDSVLAAVSPGEWVIAASAAARQGPYRMAALNAGMADIVPRYAHGGPVGGYAAVGQIALPAVRTPAANVTTNIAFNTEVTVNGGATQSDARLVREEVEAALSDVASRIRAGAGKR